MVALSYANLATDLIAQSRWVVWSPRDGKYTHIPLSTVISGIRRVDVDELSDRENYRPKVANMLGKPMFLY